MPGRLYQAGGPRTANQRWTTDLDEALAGSGARSFMDCAATGDRPKRGPPGDRRGAKHIFIEEADGAHGRRKRWRLARAGRPAPALKHGVIQDKLFLPGFAKLVVRQQVRVSSAAILSVKIDAGSWIFDGTEQECQRPSWNYRKIRGRRPCASI